MVRFACPYDGVLDENIRTHQCLRYLWDKIRYHTRDLWQWVSSLVNVDGGAIPVRFHRQLSVRLPQNVQLGTCADAAELELELFAIDVELALQAANEISWRGTHPSIAQHRPNTFDDMRKESTPMLVWAEGPTGMPDNKERYFAKTLSVPCLH